MAWDPVQQKQAWAVERPGPWNGGTLATAGNLVFEGTAAGRFEAYRADTGERVWSFDAQTGVMAGPATYSVNGEQYVAVLAGGAEFFLWRRARFRSSQDECAMSAGCWRSSWEGRRAFHRLPPYEEPVLNPPPSTRERGADSARRGGVPALLFGMSRRRCGEWWNLAGPSLLERSGGRTMVRDCSRGSPPVAWHGGVRQGSIAAGCDGRSRLRDLARAAEHERGES